MKSFFLLSLLTFPFLVQGQDPSITTCGPRKFQKGIGVGNNNYQGRNCVVEDYEVETVTIIRDRKIATEKEETPSIDVKKVETGYDYYDGDDEK